MDRLEGTRRGQWWTALVLVKVSPWKRTGGSGAPATCMAKRPTSGEVVFDLKMANLLKEVFDMQTSDDFYADEIDDAIGSPRVSFRRYSTDQAKSDS